MKARIASFSFVLAVVSFSSEARATGVLVGGDGAVVAQSFARVVVVHGEKAASVLEQPWPARGAAQPRVYLAPVPAFVTTVAIVPLTHGPEAGRLSADSQDQGAVVSFLDESDPCGPEPDRGGGGLGVHIPKGSQSTRSELGSDAHGLEMPLPAWPAAAAVSPRDVARSLPSGVTLESSAATALAQWAARGLRVVVVPLQGGSAPPAIRWTATGLGPRAAVEIPSTRAASGGPREVVVDIYASTNIPFAIDNSPSTRLDALDLTGTSLERAFRHAVDGFFAATPTGALLESAATGPVESSAAILAPIATPPSTVDVDVDGSFDGVELHERVDCPLAAAKLLPRKLLLALDESGRAHLPASTPAALARCLAPIAARQRLPLNERRFEIDLQADPSQHRALLPDVVVSRLRVRPPGAGLRIVAGHGSAEPFVARPAIKRPWTGPIACDAPHRGQFSHAPGSSALAALVDTGDTTADESRPAQAPPPPSAAASTKIPRREMAPNFPKPASGCGGFGAGWLAVALISLSRQRQANRRPGVAANTGSVRP